MKKVFFCLILFITNWPAFAQNLFDFEHSLKFAKHLYLNGQYGFAAQEFDRLCFMHPDNDSLLFWKLKSVGRAKLFEKYTFKPERIQASPLLSSEYASMLMQNKRYAQSLEFVNQNKVLDKAAQSKLLTANYLLQADVKNARQCADSSLLSNKNISLLLLDENRPKHRSPAIALALSTIVPGAGKLYTGRYSDALSSFLLVAVNAWQAYSGFNKLGNRSLYAWFFTGMGASFYLGNLYGSYHSAHEFNQIENERFSNKAQGLLFSDR